MKSLQNWLNENGNQSFLRSDVKDELLHFCSIAPSDTDTTLWSNTEKRKLGKTSIDKILSVALKLAPNVKIRATIESYQYSLRKLEVVGSNKQYYYLVSKRMYGGLSKIILDIPLMTVKNSTFQTEIARWYTSLRK